MTEITLRNVRRSNQAIDPQISIRGTRQSAMNPFFGIRESCEDTICEPICSDHKRMKDWTGYRACKEKCFDDHESDITDCCQRICGNDLVSGPSNTMCMQTCSERLVYGGTALPEPTPSPQQPSPQQLSKEDISPRCSIL